MRRPAQTIEVSIPLEITVEASADVEAYDPGVYSGPYENSYPAEGGNADITAVTILVGTHRVIIPIENVPQDWLDELTEAAELEAAEQ